MRVAILHNRYQQSGGEDKVVEQESDLLARRGHEVLHFTRDNRSISGHGSLRLATQAVWSRETTKALREFLGARRPDLVHVHNTFPLLSPAVFHVARGLRCPTVFTLHNYRLLCPAATFFRGGKACTSCLGKLIAWPGISHGCYRESRAASAAVAATTTVHRLLGTWTGQVDAFIALTEFARDQFVEGGLPPHLVHVRSNYVENPGGQLADVSRPAARALYVGRLSEEKGVRVLIDAWRTIPSRIDVYGDGPLLETLRGIAPSQVRFHGSVPREIAMQAMREAGFLIVPSIWYEAMPLVVLEAMSVGLPVLASRLGSLEEIVDHEASGLHFEAGDSTSLASAALRLQQAPELRARLGRGARAAYLTKYTPEQAYDRLLKIYRAVGA